MEKIEWFDEHIKDVPNNKKLYKFMCFFLFKKKGLTYKEMYLILEFLKRKKLGEKSKESAMLEIVEIYKYNQNKL